MTSVFSCLLQYCLWLFPDFEIYHDGSDSYKTITACHKNILHNLRNDLPTHPWKHSTADHNSFPLFLTSQLLTQSQSLSARSRPCHCPSMAEAAFPWGFLTPSGCGFHTEPCTVIHGCVLSLQAIYLQICSPGRGVHGEGKSACEALSIGWFLV
jgi:hypothetical protein